MYVYKILSKSQWQDSEAFGYIKPQSKDTHFFHLCEEAQIASIFAKFWQDETEVVIIKLDPRKLIGKLIKEKNPGGTTEYYHLYNGCIPLTAVVETRVSLRIAPPTCDLSL